MSQPTEKSLNLINNYVKKYCERTGLNLHPMADVSEAVVTGLAMHLDQLKRPLCPCRFYPDKQQAVEEREWLCPCSDMKNYKYCHCMLFVNKDGMPVTANLPEDHEGRATYGEIADPAPEKSCRVQKDSK